MKFGKNKLNIGQIVYIKTIKECLEDKTLVTEDPDEMDTSYSFRKIKYNPGFDDEMIRYFGKKATIKDLDEPHYVLDIDSGSWFWPIEALVPIKFKLKLI